MSNLKKIADEDRESKFGYVYAVSGPGKLHTVHHMTVQCSAVQYARVIEQVFQLNIFNSIRFQS